MCCMRILVSNLWPVALTLVCRAVSLVLTWRAGSGAVPRSLRLVCCCVLCALSILLAACGEAAPDVADDSAPTTTVLDNSPRDQAAVQATSTVDPVLPLVDWPTAPNRLSGTISGLEPGARAHVWIEAEAVPPAGSEPPPDLEWELGNGPWQQQVAGLPSGRYLARAEAEGYVLASLWRAFEVFEPGITWHYNLMDWTFLRCDERARLTEPYCTQPPDSTVELPLSGLRGEVTGLAPGQVATVTVRFWPPDDGEPFPPVPAGAAGDEAVAVAALDSLPPGAGEWVAVAHVPARDGRWGRIDFEMAGARYLVTAQAAGQAAMPAAYSVTLFDAPVHGVAEGVDWRFAPAGAAAPAVPRGTATATGSSRYAARSFRLEALPLEVMLPAGWAAAPGPVALGEGFDGLVAFNSWGAAEEWVPAWSGGRPPDGGAYTRVWKLPPGGAYVALLLRDEPPWGPAYPSGERQERDLAGVWRGEDCREIGRTYYKAGGTAWIPFDKWGRQLQLEVYCRGDASDETVAAVDALLSSWRFDEVLPRDAGWAVDAARRLLPDGVYRDGFPTVSRALVGRDVLSATLPEAADARSTRVEWQGDTVLVTFEYRWRAGLKYADPGQPYDFHHWWRYHTQPDGRVALSAEGGDPIPGVTAPLPLAHHVDPELGFAADYPAGWQVLPVTGTGAQSFRRFLVRQFDSGMSAFDEQIRMVYTIQVWMAEAAGATVTETLEAELAAISEGLREQFQGQCCVTLGG
ncbi:MAG TPA: hypothetical protein VLC95_14465, partial [Anaerolineae bacterium]|nr:hypothetical protein [Anaerolineae bacterium]